MNVTTKSREKQCPAKLLQTMQEYALWYASLGMAVVPVHSVHNGRCSCRKASNCSTPGKHPRTRHGTADATMDPTKIKQWKWETANIGIATGQASGVIVIDVDPRNGGNDSLQRLQEELGDLPPHPHVKSGGGGWHLFFKSPTVKLRQPASGVDVKADGGFVVAPPSVHVSGTRYTWQIPPTELAPPELPETWLAALSGGVLQGRECLTGS